MRSSITIGILAAVAGKVTYAHVNADCEGVTVDYDGYSFEFKPCGEGRHKSSSITITNPVDQVEESVFTFCDDGLVTNIVVDGESEEYVVKYDSDGELDEVESKSSDRRGLRRGGHHGGGEGRGRGGRHDSSSSDSYDSTSDNDDVCSECEALIEVCQGGGQSVCDLVGYGDPISSNGQSVIFLMCEALTACTAYNDTIDEICLALCDEDGGSDSSDGSDSMDTTDPTTP